MTSSSSALSGVARLRQMLMSDAIAVTPVKPVPGEQQRQGPPRDEIDSTEDAVQRGGRAAGSQGRPRARGAEGTGGRPVEGGEPDPGPVTPGPVPLGAGPTAGFVTQSIAQEAVGTGLHIEPWNAAIQAYRRADTGPAEPMVSRVTV